MQTKGFDVSAIMNEDQLQVWVDFNDQAKVLIKHVPREKFSALVKAATQKGWDRKHQPTEDFDNIRFGELLGTEAIADWSGFIVSGKPLSCTPENITMFMRKWADFARFVADICTDLERLVDAEKAATVKNSSSTSGPA